MPHIFLNRRRQTAVGVPQNHLVTQFFWECLNATCYLVGALFFVAASIHHLPGYDAAVGSWLFIPGSTCYLIVSLHDALEVLKYDDEEDKTVGDVHRDEAQNVVEDGDRNQQHYQPKKPRFCTLDFLSAMTYILGSGFFISGSIIFAREESSNIGVYGFILGSSSFLIASIFNTMQIFDADALWIARNMNIVAATYLVGSTLYLVGSVPYLIPLENPEDQERIRYFLGGTFVAGSIAFLIGGGVSFSRPIIVLRNDLQTLHEQQKRFSIPLPFTDLSVKISPSSYGSIQQNSNEGDSSSS